MGFRNDHAADSSLRRWQLVELDFSPIIRHATGDIPITALGFTWTVDRVVEVANLADLGGVLTGGTVRLSDIDGTLIAIMRATGGGQNVTVTIYDAWFSDANATAVPDDVTTRAAGKIVSARKVTSGANCVLELTLGPTAQMENMIPTTLWSALSKA